MNMRDSSSEDPVSRYVTRWFGGPLAGLLASTPVTPAVVSLASFLAALAVLATFAVGESIAAGLLIVTVVVVDGVSRALAGRRAGATRFGEVLGATLNRYAEAAVVGGMTWWAWSHPELSGPQPFVVGLGVLTGFFMVSYLRSRMESEGYAGLLSADAVVSSRDTRLLLAAAGSLVGQTYWTLVVLGSLSFLVVIWRFWLLYHDEGAKAGAHS